MNTIQELWDSFNMLVVPTDASNVQRQEMRRSFYAGVEAMCRIQFSITAPEVSEDEAVKILSAVNDELNSFAQKVQQGKA